MTTKNRVKKSRKRFRATRLRKPTSAKVRLNIFDAKEALDMGSINAASSFTVDAGKYGISAKMIDLQTWDTWNSAKAEILKSQFKVFLGGVGVNTNFDAAIVLIQYYGNAPADRVDLAQTESLGNALATQFAALQYKYRVLASAKAKQTPDNVTSGSYLSTLEFSVPIDKIWKQIEKFCGEQTGMTLMPDNKFGLWLVCKTTAAAVVRTFTSYTKRFKFRSTKDIGL